MLSVLKEFNVLRSTVCEFLVLLDDLHGCVVGVHITLAGSDDGLLVVALRAVAFDGGGSLVELACENVSESLVRRTGAGELLGCSGIVTVEDVDGACIDLGVRALSACEQAGSLGEVAFAHCYDTLEVGYATLSALDA